MKQHALSVFHCPPDRLNCAQAILDAYQTVTGRHVAAVADFKAFGGGRAPGGACGALYAACQGSPDFAEAIRDEFSDRAGSTLCHDLKHRLHFPCTECVSLSLPRSYIGVFPPLPPHESPP
ncbi:MAG: hypothetical protein PHQ04_00540 [Opitutaceae bacterium]|nr:hypothetical protein [Opitutaceae bacterium]